MDLIGMPGSSGNFDELYKIDVNKVLGSGGFGIVYKGFRLKDGESVAIKEIRRSHVPEEDWLQLNDGGKVPKEIYMLWHCREVDGVIHLLDWFDGSPDYIRIVLECPEPCEDLFYYINGKGKGKGKGPLSENMAKQFFGQVVKTVVDCASINLYHRDIKDENVLVELNKNRVKLLDFGVAGLMTDGNDTDFRGKGTDIFCPPEWLITKHYYQRPAAVWSLGCLLYSMIYAEIPYSTTQLAMKGVYKLPSTASESCRDLIRKCLQYNVPDRIKLELILEHPWFIEKFTVGGQNTSSPSPAPVLAEGGAASAPSPATKLAEELESLDLFPETAKIPVPEPPF